MAEKKKTAPSKKASSDGKRTEARSTPERKLPDLTFIRRPQRPTRSHWTSAVATLIWFFVFLLMSVKPEGALLKFFHPILLGLFGKMSFIFSIPALLFAVVILVINDREPVDYRCRCLFFFVLTCGCLQHIAICDTTFSQFEKPLKELYDGGINGSTGGVLCGLFTMFLRWLLGDVLTYLILGTTAALTLLGSMKITVPSIIRAIKNRPRADWDDDYDDDQDRLDPAAAVINHLANKHLEYQRMRRQRRQEQDEYDDFDDYDDYEDEPYPEETYEDEPFQEECLPAPVQKKAAPSKSGWIRDMMNQIINDVADPVSAAAKPVANDHPWEDEVEEAPVPVETDVPEEVYHPAQPAPAPRKEAEKPVQSMKEKVTARDAAVSAQLVAEEIAKAQTVQKPVYSFPPIDLLNRPSRDVQDGTAEMRENSRRLNETLESFKIDAHIINVTRGPSVTRYEVELDKGVRLNKLTTVADDIALSLGAPSVRIAPVPNKISVVGIEVPNRAVTTVTLREVIDSSEFSKSKSRSSFAVGKDIGGSCIIGNIAKMPHMLIAGTTGSGKSVCMNSLIISLLYKSGPEDVKLIMVDPKMVELANYNGIPHLMIPVVTDPKKAAGALQWAVTEMMRRYKTMSDAGVRDLESYNSIVMAEDGEKVPQLIVIIDELADLMLVAAKEVEDSICRIAQMGRAAGIHLVIATQRPSADVITGLMKANIPSRIAFSVASAMESRIILDTQGAEKLVGRGDMLFAPIGCGKPMRVQGCFVSDPEVEAVANYVKEHYESDYDQQVLKDIEKNAQQTGKSKPVSVSDPEPNSEELDGDEMLPAAVDVILETGQASVSMLQRRLKLGYARAARIVDEMEEKGIVGPFQGSKPRAILITKEQWEQRKAASTDQMDFDDVPFDEGVPEELL